MARRVRTKLTTWTVFVMRDQLEPGLHIEFHKSGSTERDSVPPLAAGDRLHLRFPDEHRSGVVIATSGDSGVIQVEGCRWNIRLATPTERLYHSPRGMTTVEWIVDASVDISASSKPRS
jgi:hypothetical protein